MTPGDIGSITVGVIILVNAAMRIRRGSPNVRLLWASLLMIVPLLGSISVIYAWVDPALGGRSYVNLFTHLVMVFSQWSVSKATEETLQGIAPRKKRSPLLRIWVPVVALVGTALSFVLLDPGSSRGLEHYDNEPAYVAYWAFTLLPLFLPAFHLVPRIARTRARFPALPRLIRVTLTLLMISFASSGLAVVAYAVTAVFPGLLVAREIVVTGTLMLFALSLAMATAALPPGRGKASRQGHLERTLEPRR